MLRTERLTLRKPTLDDMELAGVLVGDERVTTFLGGGVLGREHWPIVVEKWVERWELNGMGPFVIERRDDGSFVGRAGFLIWDVRDIWTQSTWLEAGAHAQPELGWALAHAQWGNGFATEAASAARDWFRTQRGGERLVSVIAQANVASQRVAERLGATPGETVQLFDTGDAVVVWEHPA
jgi:RimJ/RimL family protein N-acetyltransferase